MTPTPGRLRAALSILAAAFAVGTTTPAAREQVTGDPTLLTCWDADRLDLRRVGITPKRKRLATDAARKLLHWAHPRATSNYQPADVLAKRGLSTSHG